MFFLRECSVIEKTEFREGSLCGAMGGNPRDLGGPEVGVLCRGPQPSWAPGGSLVSSDGEGPSVTQDGDSFALSPTKRFLR